MPAFSEKVQKYREREADMKQLKQASASSDSRHATAAKACTSSQSGVKTAEMPRGRDLNQGPCLLGINHWTTVHQRWQSVSKCKDGFQTASEEKNEYLLSFRFQ